jgi:CRP-like cAMP-binding protein
MGAVALGSLAAPALVRALGARASFVVVGAILPAVSLATYRRLRALAFPAQSTEALDLIHQVPMFAPLSLAAKERLARALTPRSVQAGDCVIRAGDVGDRFYIVADGAFDVDVDGTHKSAHAPDYFGEIALLRDVPRTATVTATDDSRLYELQRDDFLAAVTGHEGAERAGREVVEARLA